MKYVLLMYAAENQGPQTPDELQAAQKDWQALRKDAGSAGVLVATHGVAPNSTATTLRVRDGKSLITDGPFAETHEQLGGFLLLNCRDLDEALRWAAKIPTAQYGSIEVRPLWSGETQ